MGNSCVYSGGGDGRFGRGRRSSEGNYDAIAEESNGISFSLPLCLKTTDSLGGTWVGEGLSASVFIKGTSYLDEHENVGGRDGLEEDGVGSIVNGVQRM